jgi:hypothetical protein
MVGREKKKIYIFFYGRSSSILFFFLLLMQIFFTAGTALNAGVITLTIHILLLGVVSIFTGISAIDNPDIILAGPQPGAPDLNYVQSDHFMRSTLIHYYAWFNDNDMTEVLNAMSLGTLTYSQSSELVKFLLTSDILITYLETLVDRSFLTDDQTVFSVNRLVEVRGTIWDFFRTDINGHSRFTYLNLLTGRLCYRNLQDIGELLDRLQHALFVINLLVGNLPEVEILPPLN